MNKLQIQSYDWAIKHLSSEGDTDLFPKLFEIEAIKANWEKLRSCFFKDLDITNYQWNGGRRFIIPKDSYSFRVATQLDPFDAIIYTAIVREIGGLIEANRIPIHKKMVFSYRFSPTEEGSFFKENYWKEFWKVSRIKALNKNCNYVIRTDITDFYNQIYLHSVENQLYRCGIEKFYITSLLNLFKLLTQQVSRGIPVGPAASHIIAECVLIPIDESLLIQGINFCRYVDDFNIFCESKKDVQIVLNILANVLDKQCKLILNKSKTIVEKKENFILYAENMIKDQPINKDEIEILEAIKKHTKNDPYLRIKYSDISPEDLSKISQDKLEKLFNIYLGTDEPNYPRIRWLLRRLAQVGAPGAVEYIIKNIDYFIPALGDVASYLISAKDNYKGEWADIGDMLINILDDPIFKYNEYLQIAILQLFTNLPSLNHLDKLVQRYNRFSYKSRREIILAVANGTHNSWLRELKEEYPTLDPWMKRALLYASKSFPKDERNFWLNFIRKTASPLEKVVIDWIKSY